MIISPLTSSTNLLQPLPTSANLQVTNATKTATPPAATTQTNTPSAVASENQIQQAVEQIRHVTENLAQNLQFSIDKDTGITVIKVMDTQTQEVVRQMPTEEAVSIARTLEKVQGLLFNDKA